jgi:uncharacterized protein
MGEVSGQGHDKAPGIRRRRWRRPAALILVMLIMAGFLVKAADDTLGPPVVKKTTLSLPGLSGAPLRVLLMSDIHVAGPDMPPARLARIVADMNRLHPDIVLIAGDFISDRRVATHHYPIDQALAPLAALRARLGTVAVMGNHDYQYDATRIRLGLQALGIRVLVNEAARIGPVTLGGMGDLTSHDALPAPTIAAMRRLGPPYVMLAHQPDSFAHLPADIPLMLAGHTHCGQIVPPLIGPIITGSHYWRRYACGMVREHGATLIVGGGLGTSDLPIRFGAHDEVWLITLTPAAP